MYFIFPINDLLAYVSASFGFALPFTFLVPCIVAIWIICNELISFFENMIDMGINIPAFLLPLVKQIKRQTEAMTKRNRENNNDEEEDKAYEDQRTCRA